MPTQLLVNVLAVGPLNPGASVTLAHNLASNDQSLPPTLVFPDRSTTIVVTATTATTVTFTNAGTGAASANFRCERGWQPEVDAYAVTPMKWQGTGVNVATVGYGQFSNTTDQMILATPTVAEFDTTDISAGVSVVALTQLTVAVAGTYRFDISSQLLHTGGGTETVTFWPRVNGTNVPNSASSIEMGNNNNRTLPYVMAILTLDAGEYVEWVFLATGGTNVSLESFPAVVGPPEVPAIPSVIATVVRLA